MSWRRRSHSLVDRTPQNLPVPLGGLAVVHPRRPSRGGACAWWSAKGPTVVAALGLLAALGGCLLGATRPPTEMGLERGHIRFDGTLLRDDGGGAYGGGTAPAVVFAPTAAGVAASGDGLRGGTRVRGHCELHQRSLMIAEECTFSVGARRYRAEDVLDLRAGPVWQRRYSDGQRVVIALPPGDGVTPVPFPVGKP